MLSEEEKKLLKIFKAQVAKEETEYFTVNAYTQLLYDSHKTALNLINRLQNENRQLKVGLNGLDKEKKGCFYEDGHTGKCLGYSFFNDDKPCIYCQTCDAISIKESD